MRLNIQISEYDCALTSIINALKILFNKDEIPLELIKIIYKNILDNNYHIIGNCATSKKTMKKVCNKINKYCFKTNYNLKIKYLDKENCTIQIIRDCINDNGLVIVRSISELDHYYLITYMDENYVYIWDSNLEIDTNNLYNMKLEIEYINSENDKDYSLGKLDNREIILLNKDC